MNDLHAQANNSEFGSWAPGFGMSLGVAGLAGAWSAAQPSLLGVLDFRSGAFGLVVGGCGSKCFAPRRSPIKASFRC